MAGLILIANPGSASRKYALFEGETALAKLHFESAGGAVICTLERNGERHEVPTKLDDITDASRQVMPLLQTHQVLGADAQITRIGLRIVAPASFFLEDRPMNEEVLGKLEAARPLAPLHVTATLEELDRLRELFGEAAITGVSDSGFHAGKPDHAWIYGLPINDADKFDIKRFGYHGLSAASVVRTLGQTDKLPAKLIICHLGSGASITAVRDGKSVDTTMGYSPLEGVVMATRSGSIDPTAVAALKSLLDMNDEQMEHYLNKQSGLLGLGGSADIRELLDREAGGDRAAGLALQTYVYSLQKAVGQMAAVLDGADGLVFTGTVGERSTGIRQRLAEALQYLGFAIDEQANRQCQEPAVPNPVNQADSKPIYVVAADEAAEMARRLASSG